MLLCNLKRCVFAGVLQALRSQSDMPTGLKTLAEKVTGKPVLRAIQLTELVCHETGITTALEHRKEKLSAFYGALVALGNLGARMGEFIEFRGNPVDYARRRLEVSKRTEISAQKRLVRSERVPENGAERQALFSSLVLKYRNAKDTAAADQIPRQKVRVGQEAEDEPGSPGWWIWIRSLKPGTFIWMAASAGGAANRAWMMDQAALEAWKEKISAKLKSFWEAQFLDANSAGPRGSERRRGEHALIPQLDHLRPFKLLVAPTGKRSGLSIFEMMYMLAVPGNRGENRSKSANQLIAWTHPDCGAAGVSKVRNYR